MRKLFFGKGESNVFVVGSYEFSYIYDAKLYNTSIFQGARKREGGPVVQWLTLFPHGKKVLESRALPKSRPFCMNDVQVLQLPSTVQKPTVGVIGYSKLPIGVNVNTNGCTTLNISPTMNILDDIFYI